MRDTATGSAKEYSPTGPTSATEERRVASVGAGPLPALRRARYTAPAPARPRPAPGRTEVAGWWRQLRAACQGKSRLLGEWGRKGGCRTRKWWQRLGSRWRRWPQRVRQELNADGWELAERRPPFRIYTRCRSGWASLLHLSEHSEWWRWWWRQLLGQPQLSCALRGEWGKGGCCPALPIGVCYHFPGSPNMQPYPSAWTWPVPPWGPVREWVFEHLLSRRARPFPNL